MAQNLFLFAASLYLVIKGAALATKYAVRLSQNFNLSRYIVGFAVIAFISILPEALISISSALKGVPAFGLGTLFGSNIADLTLIFAILIIRSGRGLKVSSRVLESTHLYPLFLLLPLLFGLDGFYSRSDGVLLILAGCFFYYQILRQGMDGGGSTNHHSHPLKNFLWLLLSMALLLVGSHFTVISATDLAASLGVSSILIGMLVVGLGTTMPELFFSLKSVEKEDDSLAVGDILGTVLADATIVVGLLATITPFAFPSAIIYVTGAFMITAALLLLKFMHSDRKISIKEGLLLLAFWLLYVLVEFSINH